jgi:hypothetical protein
LAAQAVAQSPQCCGSVWKSTHAPLHFESQLEVHVPPEQDFSAAQAFAHPPQLAESLLVSTQPGPHLIVPLGHSPAQTPAPHTSVAEHAWVHAPQFAESLDTSTQTPWQSTNGFGHDAPASGGLVSAAWPHALISTAAPTAPSHLRRGQTEERASMPDHDIGECVDDETQRDEQATSSVQHRVERTPTS